MSSVAPLSAEQIGLVQAWRALALERMPYMASMLFSLRVLNAPGLGTFAVDRWHRLYVDFDEVSLRGPKWCAEALLHECGHLFGEHADRAVDAGVGDAERMDSNVAADAEINDDLRDAGCDMSDAVLPGLLGEPDYRTYEHYLEAIRRRRAQHQQQADGEDKTRAGTGQGNNQQDPQPTYRGCGSGSGGQPAPCELDPSDDLDGHAPAATNPERERTLIVTATAIRDHATSGRGTIPAGLLEKAEQLLTPSTTPWRKLLASTIRRSVAHRLGDHDITYSRRNRRRHNDSIVWPGTHSPTPNIAVVRDTSGSMGATELDTVTREVDAISRQIGIRGRNLRVLDVDVEVAAIRDYKTASTLTEIAGRGGTDMCAGIDAAQELRPRPTVIVVITDGGTPWPNERPRTPVIACLVGPYAQHASTPDWLPTITVTD